MVKRDNNFNPVIIYFVSFFFFLLKWDFFEFHTIVIFIKNLKKFTRCMFSSTMLYINGN